MNAKLVPVVFVLGVISAGCMTTPPAVMKAQQTQKEALWSIAGHVTALLTAYHNDLTTAQMNHLRERFISMVQKASKAGNVSLEEHQTIWTAYEKRRAEIIANLKKQEEKAGKINNHFAQIFRLHEAIEGYLKRKTITPEDTTQLMGVVLQAIQKRKSNVDNSIP